MSTSHRYIPKTKKKAMDRKLNIKEHVLSTFMKQAEDTIKHAFNIARDAFNRYMSSPALTEEKLSYKWHSTKESEILIADLNLQEFSNGKDLKVATITIPESQRINGEEGEKIMKLTFAQDDRFVKKSLNSRNPSGLNSDLKEAHLIIIEDNDGGLMAIILRNIIPLGLSSQSNCFRRFYEEVGGTIYSKGCRAATYPSVQEIMRNLRDPTTKDAAGIKSSNVKKVTNLRVTKTGKNVILGYRNKKGKSINWAFTSSIDRKAFDLTQFHESEFTPLLQFMKELYENVSMYWLHKFGCDGDNVKEEVAKAMDDLKVTGALIKQHHHKLGIHSDPSSKFPSLVFGPSIYSWDNEKGEWGDRICNGGRLVLVDGCLYLEYGPQDVIVLNGNLLHTVTNLKPKKNGSPKGDLTRFSMQLYTNYKRNENKHRMYGTFSSWW